VGALLALLLTHNDLSIIAIIGIILLIGIVKKNAIMMIDSLWPPTERGQDSYDSIVEACRLRFRPILMTTMAALLGALPLALGSGTGSELRRPLGITINRRADYEPVADSIHDAGGVSCTSTASSIGGTGWAFKNPQRPRRPRSM